MLDKIFGHHATGVSLNDRFTMLASIAPLKPARPRRRTVGSLIDSRLNFHNRDLIEQIARRLALQSKRRTLRQRLGVPSGALRRFGSESSLAGLGMGRSASYGSFGQLRGWRGSNGNLSRTSSFTNLSQQSGGGRMVRRGFKRRGAANNRQMNGQMRGVQQGRVTRSHSQQARPQVARRGRGTGRARGVFSGRGRGGIGRQTPKPVPSREELDNQLDEYMASSKSVLDRQLDQYMETAVDIDNLL